MSEYKLPLREDIPEEKTWDLTTIFPTTEAWEEEFSALSELAEQSKSYQGTLGESAEKLLAALKFRDELYQRLARLSVYARLQEDTDTRNAEYQNRSARSSSLATKAMAGFSFFQSEIMALDEDLVRGYLKEDDQLSVYTHAFEEMFLQRPYILSQREEEILAKASEPLASAETTFAFLDNADLTFPVIQDEQGKDVQISHGLYTKLLENKDKRVRKDAYQGMFDTYGSLKNTFASTLSGTVKSHNFTADVRGYNSARHQSLAADVVPESVYDALVEAVNEKLPALHRYVDLRKKVLALDEVHMYDMYVPMIDEVDMNFSYEEAQEIVLEGLEILGEEYQSIVKRAFDERWIDPIENQGKRSGAYSSGTFGTNPYILMNWQNNLDNVYTLAHELGHSVHSYYTRSTQPYPYARYSIFLAEIASTTNEILLTEHLLKKYDDPRVQAYIINHFLDGVKGTVFRQTQFAEFEHLIHTADAEGNPLTADFLSKEYAAINKKYYGSAVSYDDFISMEWARIPHFYYDYYVFQYATGFSAASAFSRRILEEGQPALDDYIGFLKAGCSNYPIEVLQTAGLDMTTNQPVLDTLTTFEERLLQLEALIEK